MGETFNKLDKRIRRSKRFGKMAFGGVLLITLIFGTVLVQAWILARETGRADLAFKALRSLCCLAGLNVFSFYLVHRQHRLLDEARGEFQELVEGEERVV